jgi:hypothetical protein
MSSLKQTHSKNGIPELPIVKEPFFLEELKKAGDRDRYGIHMFPKGPFTRPTAPAQPKVARFRKAIWGARVLIVILTVLWPVLFLVGIVTAIVEEVFGLISEVCTTLDDYRRNLLTNYRPLCRMIKKDKQ